MQDIGAKGSENRIMRRKDREITDRREIDAILNQARVCRVAFAHEDEPYLAPLFFGYDGQRLYLHSAQRGKKLEFIAANPTVCFEVEGEVHILPDEAEACGWTAHFESVIGYGKIIELRSAEEKIHGLNQIMRHYSGQAWTYSPAALKSVRVWAIEITSMTGKAVSRTRGGTPLSKAPESAA